MSGATSGGAPAGRCRLIGLEQLLDLLPVQLARQLVQVRLVGVRRLLGLVVAALQAPDVEPLGRRRGVLAEEVVGRREPLVDVLLEERPAARARPSRSAAGPCARCRGGSPPRAASVPSSARAARTPEVESMLSWNLPSRSTNSVYVKKSTQLSTSTLKEPSSRLFCQERRSRSLRASILPVSPKWLTSRWHICQPCRISSTMIRQHAVGVVVRGRGLEQVALLLDGGELGVALVDDQVQERVADRLVGDLRDALPLAARPGSPRTRSRRSSGPRTSPRTGSRRSSGQRRPMSFCQARKASIQSSNVAIFFMTPPTAYHSGLCPVCRSRPESPC